MENPETMSAEQSGGSAGARGSAYRRRNGYLCQTCGIGYYLPSNVCDHCNQPAPEAGWYCDKCDKHMAESDAGYCHTNGICYCSEKCAEEHDANQ